MTQYTGKTGSVNKTFTELSTQSSGHPNTFNPIYRQLMDNDAELEKKVSDHAAAADPHPQYATDTDLTNHTGAADPHTQYAKKAGDTFTGMVTVNRGAETLALKTNDTQDHVYMSLYADSQAPTTRSGYLGFASPGLPSLHVTNEMLNGDIVLTPNGTGGVSVGKNIKMNNNSIVGANQLQLFNGTRLAETSGQRTSLNAEADRFDVVSEDGSRYILRAEEGTGQLQFMRFDMLGAHKVVRSGKDANGIFTQVDYYRSDEATLFQRTILSGTPDANGNYPYVTIKRFANDGTTEVFSLQYIITYDADGDYTMIT